MDVIGRDEDLAIALAGAAGDVLLQAARSRVLTGRELGHAGDVVANELLPDLLVGRRELAETVLNAIDIEAE